MANPLHSILWIEVCLFALTMALVNARKTKAAGEYCGIAFHLLLLPVVVQPVGSSAVQAAAYLWIGCDVIASVMSLWRSDANLSLADIAIPIRMAGHLFAAVWIIAFSQLLTSTGLAIGHALGASFAAYTLSAGRLPQKFLALPGVLMLAWLLLLASTSTPRAL